jgi:hypothetical protein
MKNRRAILAFFSISVALSLGTVPLCWAEDGAGAADGPAAQNPYSFDPGLRSCRAPRPRSGCTSAADTSR